MERDALGPSREAGRRCGEPAQRAIGEAQAGDGDILGLHSVQPVVPVIAVTHATGPGQRQRKVDGVDRLRDQDAAAIARIGAAPGFVVIGLFPPPRHRNLRKAQRAEPAAADKRERAATGRLPHAVLKHDAQRHAGRSRRASRPLRPPQVFGPRVFPEDRFPACASGAIRDARASGGVRIRAMSTRSSGKSRPDRRKTDLRAPRFPQPPPRNAARAVRIPRQHADQAHRHIRIPDRQHMCPGHHSGADHRDPRGLRPVVMASRPSSRTARPRTANCPILPCPV
jgi:hypothetical protein